MTPALGLRLRRREAAAGGPDPRADGPWGPAPVIEVRSLLKTYGHGDAVVRALGGPPDPDSGTAPGVDLVVRQGDRATWWP
ncbi:MULTISPECIES: hypothetical protein [Streptomyces]|nr:MULTISPECIES: hypothetical protein [Streptomyces]